MNRSGRPAFSDTRSGARLARNVARLKKMAAESKYENFGRRRRNSYFSQKVKLEREIKQRTLSSSLTPDAINTALRWHLQLMNTLLYVESSYAMRDLVRDGYVVLCDKGATKKFTLDTLEWTRVDLMWNWFYGRIEDIELRRVFGTVGSITKCVLRSSYLLRDLVISGDIAIIRTPSFETLIDAVTRES